MKSFLTIFICLLLVFSCKKKEDEPQPAKADEVTYQTDFSDTSWPTHSTTKYSSAYNTETFKISVDTMSWMAYEMAPYVDQLDYTYLMQVDVTVTLTDENQMGRTGFIYNYIDSANYCFMNIRTNGTFYAYQKQNSLLTILFYNTYSKDLKKGSGQTNTIAIRQYENSQKIIFNGVSQGSLPFKLERGYRRVGLSVSSESQYYTPVSATFDNFVIKRIY